MRNLARLLPSVFFAAILYSCGDSSSIGGGPAQTPEDSEQCTVRFHYSGEASVDAVELRVDYSAVMGDFGEPLEGVRCRPTVGKTTESATRNLCDDECAQGESRVLLLRFHFGQSADDNFLSTPSDLFECLFEGESASLDELSFEHAEVKGTGITFPLLPAEGLAVEVECNGWPEPTTSTTTSTTFPAGCEEEPCEARTLRVDFTLEDAVTPGALQWAATFPAELGAFQESPLQAAVARCTLEPGINALFSVNQSQSCQECPRVLRAGIASLNGFPGPTRLLSCWFDAEGDLDESDFTIAIEDASDPQFNAIVPAPTISISFVEGD